MNQHCRGQEQQSAVVLKDESNTYLGAGISSVTTNASHVDKSSDSCNMTTTKNQATATPCLSGRQLQIKKHIIITKCLSDHCNIFYTDTLSQSILIECKDPKHQRSST